MVNSKNLLNIFHKNKINFFTGVPDSVLKKFLFNIKNFKFSKHIIAVNEGAAVGLGIGHYLANKKRACVYMQNSGLGNAINPLISIAHSKVYQIPMVLLIGWRGSPKSKDEPQHMVKGKITLSLLKLLNIKYCIVKNESDLKKLNDLIKKNKKNTVACLIENNKIINKKFSKGFNVIKNFNFTKHIDREFFLKTFFHFVKGKFKIISSTGHTSRAIMQVREKYKISKGEDFYMIGGMGHTNSVAQGFVLQSKKKVYCIDGDGSMLMHLGSLFTCGYLKKINLKYILLNNLSHESVGGQKTYLENLNVKLLTKSLGFKNYFLINRNYNLKSNIKKFINSKNLSFLEVKTTPSNAKNLPRPKDLKKIRSNFLK